MCTQKGYAAATTGGSLGEQILIAIIVCSSVLGGSTFFALALLLCSGVLDETMAPRAVQAAAVTTSFASSLTTTSTTATSTFTMDDPYGAMGVCNGNCTWLWDLNHDKGAFGSGAGAHLLRGLGATIKSILPLLLLLTVIYLFMQAAVAQHATIITDAPCGKSGTSETGKQGVPDNEE
ncbi:hypothetical protein LTR36_005601 [Oleoguttula mirabilis]|uniref:Uncharacterized protein n=1 Tax=Oleoguttula mirabilis TaxID=1507867 RepID=A0AAV9JE56_9PEZI|nr:hypothetical protein LTR36_005601 [Oleoguttula mirabilis]